MSGKYGAAILQLAIAIAAFLATDLVVAQACTGHRLRFYNIIGWGDGFTQYYGPWVYYENDTPQERLAAGQSACQAYVARFAQENADRRFNASQGYTSAGYRDVWTDGSGCWFTLYGVHPVYGEHTAGGGAGNESWANQCPPFDPFKSAGEQCSASGGNPINFTTGNKYQTERDYRSPDGTLDFSRYYNSQTEDPPGVAPYVSAIGKNWRSTYDRAIRMTASGDTAYAIRSDGKTFTFRLTAGVFASDADVTDRLVKVLSSGVLTGWQYTVDSTGDTEVYDASGRLLSITARTGPVTTLTYGASGRLEQVTNAFGRSLSLAYDGLGRLATLTDPAGQQFIYGYGANEGKNVGSVTFPGGSIRSYVYGETANTAASYLPNALTGILDEASTRYATFRYNAWLQAVSTEHAGTVEKYEVQYSANPSSNSVSFTDPLGQSRTLTLSTVQGMRRVMAANVPSTLVCAKSKASDFDGNANTTSKTDFNDHKTCYAYDTTRNLETMRVEGFAPGVSCPPNLATYTPTSGTRQRKISTQWHSTYRLPTQIDEADKRTTFTHDGNGNVLTKTVLDTSTSESRTWTYTYNSLGQVLTADGPRTDVSDVTTYTYYSCATGYQCGQVHTITNALGHVTTYNTYNAHGQPLTITDPNGVVTTLTYDLRQRLTSRTVGSEQTTLDYWPTGLLKKATLPDGSFLEYTYDGAHRLTQIEDSEGNRVVYTLDAMGNRTAENLYDPSNVLTQTRTRVFNTLNQLWKEIGAAGTVNVATTFAFDNNGNQTGINAPLARQTAQGYDELNRLTQVTDPLSGITQYGYDALDQLIAVTDPRNKVTSYAYNALGDLTQQLSPDTGTTTNTYDSGGNLATSTDARSKTATYAYDALNRVTSVTYADQTISYTYDTGTSQNGRLTQVSDASGSTSWNYDAHGRVLSRQQSMGVSKTLGYAYDSSGRLQTLTLPSGNTINYGYTDGKVTSLMLNGSTTILSNVLYQPFGPTRGWTWGNGSLAVREYDADGKVSYIDSAGLKSYSYDDAFRITGITDATEPSLTQGYGYDKADRLTHLLAQAPQPLTIGLSTTTAAPGAAVTVTVNGIPAGSGYWLALARSGAPVTTYSKWTQVTPSSGSFVWNVTIPSFAGAYEVRLFTDGFSTLLTAAALSVSAPPPGQQTTLVLDGGSVAPGGSVTVRLANGSGGFYDFLTLAPVGSPITTYLQWTYVGNGVTNRDWTVTMPNTEGDYEFRYFLNGTWTLGAASGPVSVNDEAPVSGGVPPVSADYTYDANGNRLSAEGSTYTLSSTSNRLMSVSGAMTRTYGYDNSGNTTSDGTRTFAYDDAGRMVSATKSGVTTTYALNALGQRVKKTTGGSSRYFVYDESGHLVGEYSNSGALIQETVWFRDIPVATLKPNGGGVDVFYVHTDHLNTPRRISRPSDNVVVWRWDSDPFGTTGANEDPDGDSSLFSYNLRFPGQYFDGETGLHYNYFRNYDPTTGRYPQSDPIGLQGGLNTYAYVGGNPIAYFDPYGLSKWDKTFGLPKKFWNWYHRKIKKPGDPDLEKQEAEELCKEWRAQGEPGPDSKGKQSGEADVDLLEWLLPWWLSSSPAY